MYDVNVEYNKEKCELSFLNMKASVFVRIEKEKYEGIILHIPETINFHAETLEGLKLEFANAVIDYIKKSIDNQLSKTKLKSEIKRFIEKFNNECIPLINIFVNKNDYWLALILSERFKTNDPEIVYSMILDRFAVKIDGYLYNANGEIENEKYPSELFETYESWELVKTIDPIKASKITLNRITFQEELNER